MNNSERKAKVLAILQQLPTEGDVKNSGIETVKSAIIALVSARIGSAIGKPSLLAGLGATFAGHYFNEPRLETLGLGLMAGGSAKSASTLKGTSVGMIDGFKEELKTFGADLKDRFYIDKFIKTTSAAPKEEGTGRLGEVQYFKYPGDMAGLDAIEDEITKSSEEFSQRQVTGTYEDMGRVEDRLF